MKDRILVLVNLHILHEYVTHFICVKIMGSVRVNHFSFGLKSKEINCLTNLEERMAKITEWSYSNILTIFGLLFNCVWIPSYHKKQNWTKQYLKCHPYYSTIHYLANISRNNSQITNRRYDKDYRCGTLGPACNEFGYNEHPAGTSKELDKCDLSKDSEIAPLTLGSMENTTYFISHRKPI